MTENNRLKEITTTFYQDASTTTLDDFIFHARRDMESRIITLYQMSMEDKNNDYRANTTIDYKNTCSKISESLYTTAFYDLFKYAGTMVKETFKMPIYHFRVNPKNINFETILTNTREIFSGMEIYPEEVCTSPKPSLRYIKDIPNWEDLFGKGEFPYMTIYVFRLGNTEYFAYTIGK